MPYIVKFLAVALVYFAIVYLTAIRRGKQPLLPWLLLILIQALSVYCYKNVYDFIRGIPFLVHQTDRYCLMMAVTLLVLVNLFAIAIINLLTEGQRERAASANNGRDGERAPAMSAVSAAAVPEPEFSFEPEIAPEPAFSFAPASAPEAAPAPEIVSAPEAVSAPEIVSAPEEASVSEIVSAPEAEAVSELNAEPAPEAEPATGSDTEAEAEPEAEDEPELSLELNLPLNTESEFDLNIAADDVPDLQLNLEEEQKEEEKVRASKVKEPKVKADSSEAEEGADDEEDEYEYVPPVQQQWEPTDVDDTIAFRALEDASDELNVDDEGIFDAIQTLKESGNTDAAARYLRMVAFFGKNEQFVSRAKTMLDDLNEGGTAV